MHNACCERLTDRLAMAMAYRCLVSMRSTSMAICGSVLSTVMAQMPWFASR